ncbi:MAG: deoxyribodipyrimidine photolyase [Vicinamibacterales bacterium]
MNPDGDFVLYWMTTARRTTANFGLQRAVERCAELRKPLVVFEALRCDYPEASDRMHQFILEGMADTRAALARAPALYYPYVEATQGHGRGLLKALSQHACAIVTDWYPAGFVPHMLSAGAAQAAVHMEAVDSNGIIPLSTHDKVFTVARSYRAFMQRTLRDHLTDFPGEHPLHALRGLPRLETLPAAITRRWPSAPDEVLEGGPARLAAFPINHDIGPVAMKGGPREAHRRLTAFIEQHAAGYADDRNHPDHDATSRMSPYLHFGHISAHEIFVALVTHDRWTSRKLGGRAGGKRDGWWGTSPSVAAYLDQLVVWRELAFSTCEYVPNYDRWQTLPDWAKLTLEKHADDPRPHHYTLAQLDAAATADEVWNAAQRQLVAEGWFHGYLRMLWGKKIYEWSPSAKVALQRMETLMNRYSLDGRDPNSYAGYMWVLGRYDRPWPERPIFGTIRYMTSASTKRKLKMAAYLAKYGSAPPRPRRNQLS